MEKLFILLLFFCFSTSLTLAQANKKTPTFEEVISLKSPGSVQLSPDGQHVLYSVAQADWQDNSFDTELWLSKNGGEPFPLTNNTDGSSSNASWSPDGKWIAFLSKRDEENKIHILNKEGGEARAISYIKGSIADFAFSPDGNTIAYTKEKPQTDKEKTIDERYGDFEIDNQEYRLTKLYTIPFETEYLINNTVPCMQDTTYTQCPEAPDSTMHLEEADFTITDFEWSPDGRKIVISHQPDPILTSFLQSDISLYDIESKELTTLVENTSADFFIDWSPDGSSLIYSSDVDNDSTNFYKNTRYFILNMADKQSREVAAGFDENLSGISWTKKRILGTAYQKTTRPLFSIDPKDGSVKKVLDDPRFIFDVSFSKEGDKLALLARGKDELNEIYTANFSDLKLTKITGFTSQINNWTTSQSEVISWKSNDGTTIEGVLHKPHNYDPDKKYPLLVAIHGGPTGISLPHPAPSYVYPMLQWLDKGALILQPNYRGSAGYGEDFRSLNVRNLGVGDAEDVLSGVDYLAKEGVIDTTRMGSMGWSQGGYISAFLTTYSNRFKAVSVGAGISNWVTYYVNTDIHPFTRQYLSATPWEDMQIYEKTSPMTYINNANTPTLIQHGEFDKRVPIPNAYELLQGLQDVGVEAKLIVYKGFGHGITKPKERLAAMWHNWQWFGKYIWDEHITLPSE